MLDALWERCAGIDIGKRTVVVCLLKGRVKETRTFGTTTSDLLALRDWLVGEGCQAAAMEATGSFWKPVWNVLEDQGLEMILANPQRIKVIPGRKSDMRDSEWIAQLLQHGLIPPSYVPDRDQRELRELERYRTSLVQECGREVNRLAKVMEGANIKIGSVLSDINGKSGQAILRAIAQGTDDPAALVELTSGRLKATKEELEAALTGYVLPHQRYMIAMILDGIDHLRARIADLDREIARRIKDHEKVLERLCTIPGIATVSASVVIAEVGPDVSHFQTAAKLASWTGLAPGQNESAGKRKSSRIPPGRRHLRSVFVQCAWAAVRMRGTHLSAMYWRLAGRIGKKKAIVAVAHALVVIVYKLLADPNAAYADLGADYYVHLDAEAIKRRALKNLETLGYTVSLTPRSAA